MLKHTNDLPLPFTVHISAYLDDTFLDMDTWILRITNTKILFTEYNMYVKSNHTHHTFAHVYNNNTEHCNLCRNINNKIVPA